MLKITITFFLTTTLILACLFPSTVLTVIVAVPGLFAVMYPLFTLAIFELLLDQVTFLFVALLGETVALTLKPVSLLR